MPTLTKARTAQLCAELRRSRVRAIALSDNGSEFEIWALMRRLSSLELILANLVGDLAGAGAMHAVNDALDATIAPVEVADYKAQQAARQRSYLAAATPATAGATS